MTESEESAKSLKVALVLLRSHGYFKEASMLESSSPTSKTTMGEVKASIENIQWNLRESKNHLEGEIHTSGLCDVQDGECELPKTMDILIQRTSHVLKLLDAANPARREKEQ